MQQLIGLLEDLSDWFGDRADVKDDFTEDGFQIPNDEMEFYSRIEHLLPKIKKMMTPEPTPIKVLISDCCGVNSADPSWEEHGLCPKCGNHTSYVSDEDRFRETDDLPEGLFTSND